MDNRIGAPKISPFTKDEKPRPFWSVMIPVYNPQGDYLEETLRGVLQQDPGEDQMQIEVVDDCSSQGAPSDLVQRIGHERVALHREPVNLGLAGIWNRCIERAMGQWIHILHQDDVVQPGFYETLRKGILNSDCGAAFSRYAIIDAKSNWVEISYLHRESAGVLENWHERITVRSEIQCAAIVVRREVYEKLGGFLPQFCYALDWEMWQRIAANYAFWFEPSILAGYRLHSYSTTSRLRLEGLDAIDLRAAIDLAQSYHSPERGVRLAREARKNYALHAIYVADQLLVLGQSRAAWKQIALSVRMSRSWPVLPRIFFFILKWCGYRSHGLDLRSDP